MLSQLSPQGQNLVHWILSLPPSKNPYLATVHYLNESLKARHIPAWSNWVERATALGFLVIFVQSVYVLYIRFKTKRFYLFKLNSLGLIQLDRANHIGLCYCLFSATAILDKVFRDLVLAGYLDRRYSLIFAGSKCLFTAWGFCIFQWLCICNWALFKWRPHESHPTQKGYFIPPILLWALNGWIISLGLWTTVSIIWMYFQVVIHYNSIRVIVNSTIHTLLASAPTYSIKTYKPMHLIEMLTPLKQVTPLQDAFVYYSRLVSTSALITDVILGMIYIPFLFLTCRSTLKLRGFSREVKKQQDQILIHAITEFVTVVLSVAVLIYMLHFPGGSFTHSPGYWIAFHTTLDLILAIGVNISMFLIRCTTSSTTQIDHNSNEHGSEFEQRIKHEKVEDKTLECNEVDFSFK